MSRLRSSWGHRTRRFCLVTAMMGVLGTVFHIPAGAEVCNIKVVTGANPDYTDIGSMIHSTTSNWIETKDKCWALWYWNHIARRQTAPMVLHGRELTDPIRQFNDYGYAMCSTVAGINCGIWGAMGLDVKFWDISLHTVPEVFYDGRCHMHDSSMSAIYTLCDGMTIADVEDIGAEGACAASGGKREPNYLLIPPKPSKARYVRFAITPERFFSVSEVQVLDSVTYKSFDLKIALPDGRNRSNLSQYSPKHVPSRPRRPGDTER